MSFVFGINEMLPTGNHVRVWAGIRTEQALMEALASVLDLPDYFGENWDALEECIRDLSWMPPGPVVLIHEDLPVAGDAKAQTTYLSILRDASQKWQGERTRSLVVVFPESAEAEVLALVEVK